MRGLVLAAAAAAVLAGVALPAGALAQSAGDEQYQDPFAPGGEQQESSGGGQAGQQPATPAPTPTPAGRAPATGAPTATAASALPRTGGGPPAAPLALLGGGLLAMGAGIALFLRAVEPVRAGRGR
jgi:hypothetical protein